MSDEKVVRFPSKDERDPDPVDVAVNGLRGFLADQPPGTIRGIAIAAIVRDADGSVSRTSMYTENCDSPAMLTLEAGLLARRLEARLMDDEEWTYDPDGA